MQMRLVDVAIQPEVRFIAKQNSLLKIGNNGHLVLGPFDALLDDRLDELPNLTENESLDSCYILESDANLNLYSWGKNPSVYSAMLNSCFARGQKRRENPSSGIFGEFQLCDVVNIYADFVNIWSACNVEDCGFQMLNADEIMTSVREESNPVDDETNEDEDNNKSSKGSSNADAFSALETAMEWYEQ
ncbi:uncharacterized protein TNCV_2951471 [Trichonephila clavipes]|nr:uncharacterized protein TNCV_2951471 [Trichonephila clavipes]